MSDNELLEFRKLIERCMSFKEDIDYYEMKDIKATGHT